jgi:hypothetical protein
LAVPSNEVLSAAPPWPPCWPCTRRRRLGPWRRAHLGSPGFRAWPSRRPRRPRARGDAGEGEVIGVAATIGATADIMVAVGITTVEWAGPIIGAGVAVASASTCISDARALTACKGDPSRTGRHGPAGSRLATRVAEGPAELPEQTWTDFRAQLGPLRPPSGGPVISPPGCRAPLKARQPLHVGCVALSARGGSAARHDARPRLAPILSDLPRCSARLPGGRRPGLPSTRARFRAIL